MLLRVTYMFTTGIRGPNNKYQIQDGGVYKLGKGLTGGFNCIGFYFLDWVVTKRYFLYYILQMHILPYLNLGCVLQSCNSFNGSISFFQT